MKNQSDHFLFVILFSAVSKKPSISQANTNAAPSPEALFGAARRARSCSFAELSPATPIEMVC
jgi:hypothetical protein